MVVVAFALLAAALYGISDFAGAWASRQVNVITVLLYSYPVGAVLMIALLPAFGGHLTGRVALFGILGGVAGTVGVLSLYSMMAIAPMNVISPITGVLAAIVPVIAGVVTGERPHLVAWFGIVLGMIAVVLVSRSSEDSPHGPIPAWQIAVALLAGLGFGLYFVFLGRAGSDTGLWTLVISRLVSPAIIVPVAATRHAFGMIRGSTLRIVLVAGCADALANMLFVLATHRGLLSISGVLTSLYPAITVLLAVTLLHEHTSRIQRAGLALGVAAVVLITA